MASPPTPGTSSKTVKWTTHLALTGDVILGTADTKNSVHNINTTMDDEEGQVHEVSINCREPGSPTPSPLPHLQGTLCNQSQPSRGRVPSTNAPCSGRIRSCGSASFADYAKRMRGSDLDRLLSQIRYRARLYLPQQDPPMATVQGADHVRGQHPLGAAS
ncbi:hypothetical protein A4X13_0g5651 [Tilletia indica]|uniref:Uncharacterized protein n=1 Tax=Tilletia indica TaxID=43049 RepID=A0A8T8SRX5_9BASI|nr:hypothetical protein A4X13_0g5651 [Tilletia indica]